MAIIPRDLDDTIIDTMVTKLQAFEAEQKAMNAAVFFYVRRELLKTINMSELPLVNIWQESIDPQRGGSSAKTTVQQLVRYNLDCYTKGGSIDDASISAEVAMLRLHYLKAQVRHGLYKLLNSDFSLPVGSIASKKWPSWKFFQADLTNPEVEVVAGRWTMELELCWKPEDITGTALDLIQVDAQKWAATYNY